MWAPNLLAHVNCVDAAAWRDPAPERCVRFARMAGGLGDNGARARGPPLIPLMKFWVGGTDGVTGVSDDAVRADGNLGADG